MKTSCAVGSWGFNYVALSEQTIAPLGEARSNSEVTRLLAARLGCDERVFQMTDRELIELAVRGSMVEALPRHEAAAGAGE